MTDAAANGALLAAPEHNTPPSTQLIIDVARKHGVSPFKQFGEMLRLRYGRRKVNLQEYYSNQIYRPEFSSQDKREFLGRKANLDLNMRLAPRGKTNWSRYLMADKMFYTALMAQMGLATTHTQAVVSKERGYGHIPTLRQPEDLVDFLANKASYPVFCKPETGSLSVGSVRIESYDAEPREIVTLTGKRVDVESFAKQVFEKYAKGFIIQSAIEQDPKIAKAIGDAVGCVRVVTIMRGDEAEVLYALWKIPSPNAMSDNYWQDGSMLAELDKTSGEILQCRRGTGPSQEQVTNHPVTGAAFEGMTIPHWDKVLELTTRAHKVFPRYGVFGWDIGIGPDGPVIIECNDNPHHTLFQMATGKGILNAEFKPVFEDLERRARQMEAQLKAQKRRKGLLGRFMPVSY